MNASIQLNSILRKIGNSFDTSSMTRADLFVVLGASGILDEEAEKLIHELIDAPQDSRNNMLRKTDAVRAAKSLANIMARESYSRQHNTPVRETSPGAIGRRLCRRIERYMASISNTHVYVLEISNIVAAAAFCDESRQVLLPIFAQHKNIIRYTQSDVDRLALRMLFF